MKNFIFELHIEFIISEKTKFVKNKIKKQKDDELEIKEIEKIFFDSWPTAEKEYDDEDLYGKVKINLINGPDIVNNYRFSYPQEIKIKNLFHDGLEIYESESLELIKESQFYPFAVEQSIVYFSHFLEDKGIFSGYTLKASRGDGDRICPVGEYECGILNNWLWEDPDDILERLKNGLYCGQRNTIRAIYKSFIEDRSFVSERMQKGWELYKEEALDILKDFLLYFYSVFLGYGECNSDFLQLKDNKDEVFYWTVELFSDNKVLIDDCKKAKEKCFEQFC